jgi:type I restriction enzyme, S subunit
MMSSDPWVPTRLDAHFQIKHGYAFKGEYFADAGPFIMLTPGNFFDEGGFKSKDQEKYYAGEVPDGYILQRGDLLVAMTEQAEGLLGSSALIPQDKLYLHNQRLGLVVNLDEDVLDKRFLYYLFNTRSVRNQIRATASGTKVRHTSPSRIGEVQVMLPPVEVQRRIVDVVSAYDDLIENNTRRIAILEEMAQAIYREWFVDFRFPGYEQVEMVESELGPVPAGWEVRRLRQVAQVNTRSLRKNDPPEEILYVDISAASTGNIGEPTPMSFADAPGRARRMVQHGDVIWSAVRPNRRVYGLVLNPPENLIVSTGFAVSPARCCRTRTSSKPSPLTRPLSISRCMRRGQHTPPSALRISRTRG